MANDVTWDLVARDKFSRTYDEANRKTRTLGGSMRGLAVTAVGLASAFAGFSILKGFVEDAAESAKIGRITAQVIKSTGGAAKMSAEQVDELSQSLSNQTAVDDELIQTGANLLLTFKNVRNEVGAGNDIFDQATAAALDLSAAGFGSVESAAKMLGKALNDPIAGMTALGRAGVTFTAQQKETIAKLVESGDILGAQILIMQEVQSQVGGAAEAAAGPMDRLKTIAANLGEEVGTVLLPYLEDFATWLVDEGVPKLEGMIAVFRDKWIPVIEDSIEFVKDHKDELILLAEAIGTVIVAVKAWKTAQLALNAAVAANPVGIFILAAYALYVLLNKLNKITGDWGDTLETVATATKAIPGFGALFHALSRIEAIIRRVKTGWNAMTTGFERGIKAIPGIGQFFGSGGREGGKFSASLTKGARAFPLPPGTYRWGRGPAGHGYDAQDLPVPTGTPVFAPASGFARSFDLGNRSYGKYVHIASSFGRIILAHLSRTISGGFVRAGQLVGFSGSTGNSTGPHLHVEPSRILRMAKGGIIPEHVIGVGLSTGTGYEFGERGPETVTPGTNGNGGGLTVIVNTGVGDPKAIGREVVQVVGNYLKAGGKLPPRWHTA